MQSFDSFYNHISIRSLKRQAADAERRVHEVDRDLDLLEERFEELVRVNHAMWQLLSEATQVSEQDLHNRVELLHKQQNEGAGFSKAVRSCVACQRVIGSGHSRCIYCGAEAPPESEDHS